MFDSSNSAPEDKVSPLQLAFAAGKIKAHAQTKKDLAKAEKSAALQAASPLKSRDDMKGFIKQHPQTGRLLSVVFNVWRRSQATRPGSAGCWAAYQHPLWAKYAKMSVATLKRHLDRLEQYGLIERQRGPFGRTPGVSFIRPTALALSLSDNNVGDRKHLGLEIGKAKKTVVTPIAVPATPQATDEKPITLDELLAIVAEEE